MNKKWMLIALGVLCFSSTKNDIVYQNHGSLSKDVYLVSLKSGTEQERGNFIRHISTLEDYVIIRKEYKNAFQGFSVRASKSDIDIISTLPEVANVYKNYEYTKLDSASVDASSYQTDNGSRETMDVKDSLCPNKGAGITIGVIDTGLYFTQVSDNPGGTSSKAFRPLSGNALDEAVYTETSLKAKVDSLGDSFNGKGYAYKNSKIFYEYDYADKDNNVLPEGSSMDHGTHVASLASANGYEFKGISPDSQLAIMKVFSSSGSASDEDITSALDDAYALDLDIVNLSLGSSLLNYEDMEQETAVGQAIKRLKDKGTVVNFAMGNDSRKQFSEGYLNFYGDKVTTDTVEPSLGGGFSAFGNPNLVASTTLDSLPSDVFEIKGTEYCYTEQVYDLSFSSVFRKGEIPYDLFTDSASIDVLSMKDNQYRLAVLKDDDSICLRDASLKLLSSGYSGIVILSDRQSRISYLLNHDEQGNRQVFPRLPIVSMEKKLSSLFDKRGTLKLKTSYHVNDMQRTVSSFSTEGPTTDLLMNPDISAPGSDIYGAVSSGYGYKSGTSMATPNFTGACALVLSEAKKTMTEEKYLEYRKDLLAVMQSTSSDVYDDEKEFGDEYNYASVRRAGSGMTDVSKAIKSSIYLEALSKDGQGTDKAGFELYGDSKASSGVLSFSFKTHSRKTASSTYKAKLYIAAPMAEKGISDSEYDCLTDMEKKALPKGYKDTTLQSMDDHLIGVYEYPDNVTIYPGDNTVTLRDVDVNKEFNNALKDYATDYFDDGMFLEGYLMLEPVDENDVSLRMPYLGFYGDYGNAKAVEDFDFERDGTKAYNSTITENIFKQISPQYQNLSLSSRAFATKGSIPGYIALTSDLLSYTRTGQTYNDIDLLPLGENPSDTKGALRAGAKDVSDLLLFQQYVNRTCINGTVELIDNATQTTLTKNWILSSYNPLNDDGSNGYLLTKSFFVSSLYSSQYVPLAISCLSLRDSSGEVYPDGNYTIRFTYNLLAKDESGNRIVQTKDVPLEISSSKSCYYTSVGMVNGKTVLFVSESTYYARVKDELLYSLKDDKTKKNYIELPLSAIENGYLRLRLYSATLESYDVLLDMKSKTSGLIGDDASDIYSYVDDVSEVVDKNTGEKMEYHYFKMYDENGNLNEDFMESYNKHGVVFKAKPGFKDIRFYNPTYWKPRSISYYKDAYYNYDEETGSLLVMGVPHYMYIVALVY